MLPGHIIKLALLFGSAAALNRLNRRIEETQYYAPLSKIRDTRPPIPADRIASASEGPEIKKAFELGNLKIPGDTLRDRQVYYEELLAIGRKECRCFNDHDIDEHDSCYKFADYMDALIARHAADAPDAKIMFNPVSGKYYFYLNQEQQDKLEEKRIAAIDATIGDMGPIGCLGGASSLMWHQPMFRDDSRTKRSPCALSPEPTHPVFSAIEMNDLLAVRHFVDGRKEMVKDLRHYGLRLSKSLSPEALEREEHLKELESELNAITYKGKTPFEYAVQQGQWDCVEILLEETDPCHGLFIPVEAYHAAIEKAVATEHYTILPLLYEKFGDPLSAMFTAVLRSGNKLDVLKAILSHKQWGLEEWGGEVPITEESWLYVFNNHSDANVARQILNLTQTPIFPWGGTCRFEISLKQQALIDQDFIETAKKYHSPKEEQKFFGGYFFKCSQSNPSGAPDYCIARTPRDTRF